MNIDELLSDAPPFSSQGSTAGGGNEANKNGGASVNIKKLRAEIEMTRARLSDQKFKITDYPDPLLPRENSKAKSGPVSAEHEERLKLLIAEVRKGGHS